MLLWKSHTLSVVLCFNRDAGHNSALFALSNTLSQEQSYGNYPEYVPVHHEWTCGLITCWKILISVTRNIDLFQAWSLAKVDKAVILSQSRERLSSTGNYLWKRDGKSQPRRWQQLGTGWSLLPLWWWELCLCFGWDKDRSAERRGTSQTTLVLVAFSW